jgi:two-component system OmpR family sensor kinase
MTRSLSIRVRLLLGMVLLVSLGLAVASTTGILLLRDYLEQRADEQVRAIGPPQGLPDERAPAVEPEDICANPRDPRGLRSDFMLVVLDRDGDVACSLGPELGEAAPDLASLTSVTTGRVQTVTSLDGGDRWRVRATEDPATSQTLLVAVSLADVDATVERLTWLSALVSVVVLLLTTAAAAITTAVGLRPLSEIEGTAERIAEGDLTERVPVYRRRTEVGRLAHALNGMLGQIEQAFRDRTESEATLRRFVSDAGHELRTPLATIQGHAELWRTGLMRDGHDLETLMSRIEGEALRMSGLVDDMLLLARLDQSRPLEQAPVDLLGLTTDAVIDAEARDPGRTIHLRAAADEPPVVTGDEARLRQVLGNLLSNALAHTPTASGIDVTVGVVDGHAVVSVADEGPGMPPDVRARAFHRFYRADAGRSRDVGGTGLGLAIVKSLTEAHGGAVSCTSSPAAGSTFTVAIPLARPRITR